MPVKSLEQQGVLALHSARSLLVKQQTMLANAMRGLATEFGLTVPQGHRASSRSSMALVQAEDEHSGERRGRPSQNCYEHCQPPPSASTALEARDRRACAAG